MNIKLIIAILLAILAISVVAIGFVKKMKLNKLSSSIGDIEKWQFSIDLVKRYPEEWQQIKKMSKMLIISYLTMVVSLGVIISGVYLYISYSDPTMIIVGSFISLIGLVPLISFSRKIALLRLKIQNDFRKSYDTKDQQLVAKLITINQRLLDNQKYILLFILLWIILMIVIVL